MMFPVPGEAIKRPPSTAPVQTGADADPGTPEVSISASGSSAADALATAVDGVPSCWICLDDEGECSKDRGPLIAPCSCSRRSSRLCHARCLARWQLQSAGTRRETQCDFCGDALPDWKHSLTPACGASAPAIMNVCFGGVTCSFQVKPGPEGYQEFTQAICRAFALPSEAELNITFTCDEPSSGALLTLQGSGAYDAAVHCASVSAARRTTWVPQPQQGATPPSTRSTDGRCLDLSPQGDGSQSGSASPSSSRPATPQQARDGQLTHRAAEAGGKGGKVLSGIGQRIRNALADLFQ